MYFITSHHANRLNWQKWRGRRWLLTQLSRISTRAARETKATPNAMRDDGKMGIEYRCRSGGNEINGQVVFHYTV